MAARYLEGVPMTAHEWMLDIIQAAEEEGWT
jgi:hypothetical protein